MKVLTLKQPYASLIAAGLKKYEFRSWKTNYRGTILIHAGSGIDKEAMIKYKSLNLSYPSKRILCSVRIVDCIKLDKSINKKINEENSFIYGNKDREGYAWKLDNLEVINSSQVINGKLGFWNLDTIKK